MPRSRPKQICLRLTSAELSSVQKAALDANLKVAAYLRSKIFPDQPAQNDLATSPKTSAPATHATSRKSRKK